MSPILDAFFLLNIHELNVTADFNHRGPLVSFLAEIFPYPARYPTLRQVHLAIRKASGPRLEFMKDKLKSLSNLWHGRRGVQRPSDSATVGDAQFQAMLLN